MIMIGERPAEVEDRAIPGHWEGDLIMGKPTRPRSRPWSNAPPATRCWVHLPEGHHAEAVRDGLVATIATLPAHLRGSLTWDQGCEMAHQQFAMATDMPVYFCGPGQPWQRGTNENTNGLLRQCFPKGTDLSVFSPADLNTSPSNSSAAHAKTLDWDTPAERFA